MHTEKKKPDITTFGMKLCLTQFWTKHNVNISSMWADPIHYSTNFETMLSSQVFWRKLLRLVLTLCTAVLLEK